ncbi:MAG: ATP synthase F1 subunit gamma [Bacteroidetes bacterium]|nr:ATP synthase F1 subunit gamma [Bacteroidota bacterium]
MATLREIKRRIVGVKNTQQITKAMKMVAAARLRRAQENIINARPYTRKIQDVLNHLFRLEKDVENPLFLEREVNRLAVVILTSDRGLCGGFNMNVIRAAEDLLKGQYAEINNSGNVDLFCLGKKGSDHFSKRNYNVVGSYHGLFSSLKFEFASSFVTELKNKFMAGEYDKVIIVFNEFVSVVQQKVNINQLLPFAKAESDNSEEDTYSYDYIYEPNKIEIINLLLPKYLNSQMWKMLLESYAAELGARMTAMDMATENAKDMIRDLQLKYNKMRQAAITNEILEIVSGANALKESNN